MNVGIVGCGLIGARRATVARDLGDRVIAVADSDADRARRLADQNDCAWTTRWEDVTARSDVDAVVVSTVNKVLAPVTLAAAQAGKHVLCEKPLGRNVAEARRMVAVATEAGVVLKTGFNHRHHPAIWRAHELASDGSIGPLMFIRAVYGHGGRPGYEKEWRCDLDLAGGGELLDQGVHTLDLCRWFLGEFAEVVGFTPAYFWLAGGNETGGRISKGQDSPIGMEDNAFALLRTARGQIAQIHTSWTQWKNRFSFEVFGRNGYLRVEGLGGSYGAERLEIGRRKEEGGPPGVEVLEYPGPDRSWHAEWEEFVAAIREGRQPLASGEDGLQVMCLIEAIYASSRNRQLVVL
jgi:predicted dehydrogenase